MLILSIIIVITIHEIGHIFFGKLFGFQIESINVFLYKQKPLVSMRVFGIKINIGWMFWGGATNFYNRDAELWKWLLVLSGGILFNLTFGFIILWGHYFEFVETYLFCLFNGFEYQSTEFGFWDFTAFLSLMLAVINALPVGQLDGAKMKQIIND
jgi:membrane-associated protease RseP (regulator of RpoE activity)